MPEIIISEFMDEDAIADYLGARSVVYDPQLVERRRDLLSLLADARVLIVRNRTVVDRSLLAEAPKLHTVGRLGVGLDNIDVDSCRGRGIEVLPATGANDAAVAEYVIAATLVLRRPAFLHSGATLAGHWPRSQMIGAECGGAKLGLLGFGSTARETARLATALGMRVSAFDPYLPADAPAWKLAAARELETLLTEADVLSVHLPLTDETRGMLDASRIRCMRAGAVLVNTSRGGIVDERAVVEALRAGHLGGAALDVFADEPLDVAGGRAFEGLDNLLLTPHIAGVTVESNIRVSRLIAKRVAERCRAMDGPGGHRA